MACSRNIEISEGQVIFVHCTGNMAASDDGALQLNFFAFRENRLPFSVHVVRPNEPMNMKLALILNPRRDQHGRVHAACVLDIDLSADVRSLVSSPFFLSPFFLFLFPFFFCSFFLFFLLFVFFFDFSFVRFFSFFLFVFSFVRFFSFFLLFVFFRFFF